MTKGITMGLDHRRWLVPLLLALACLAPPRRAVAGSLFVRWDFEQPLLFPELAHCEKLARELIDHPPAVLDREKDRFVLHYSGIGIEERWLVDPITCRAVGIRLSFESVFLSQPGEPPPDESEQAELLRQAGLAPPLSAEASRVVEAAELHWADDDGDWQELAERQLQAMEVVESADKSSARCAFKGPANLWKPEVVVHGPQKPVWSPAPVLPPDYWLPGAPQPSRDQQLIKPFFLSPTFSCPCLKLFRGSRLKEVVNLNLGGKHLWLRQSEDGSARAVGQRQAKTDRAAWWMIGGSLDQPLGAFHGFLWVLDYADARVVAIDLATWQRWHVAFQPLRHYRGARLAEDGVHLIVSRGAEDKLCRREVTVPWSALLRKLKPKSPAEDAKE